MWSVVQVPLELEVGMSASVILAKGGYELGELMEVDGKKALLRLYDSHALKRHVAPLKAVVFERYPHLLESVDG